MSAAHPVATLYTEHHRWLHAWLRKKLGCTHQAADLAHDTFLRLLNHDEIPPLSEPRAFLTTVARRVLSNHWRHERIERAFLETLAHWPEAIEPSAEEKASLIETLVEIDRFLDGLPSVVKRCFLHAQLDGMSHADIAAELNISLSSVKRYLTKAAAQCYFALAVD
ncbi:sigma-70 family RNA polymerase sigma factor [Azonexus sp. R2A61]|uniref:sigma-70 family RNA polymerase sigma factor n=1 Tax=Azonexus sp. R2A61 TaxID=2744443 RepID=UPI001F4346A2